MTVTLPATLTYGKVVGRFLLAVGDTAEDPDTLPNAVAAQGTISFTSTSPLSKETAATPPTTVVRSVITCTLDSEGYLVDPTGARGVWLVSGVYKVAYSLNTGAIASHDILVTPEHDDDTPLDLINAMPPSGPILTASQYAELSARMDALEVGGGELGPDENYVTDAEKTKLSNLSGTNTGDQDLSGLVPVTRTVNDKPLSANVTLTASDVGAATPQQVNDGDTATLSAAQSHAQGLVDALTAASPATLDTLAEIATALGEDPNFAATMTNALANRVRIDAAQSLTVPQQAQARSNLGLGTAATTDTGDFATAAQGAKADAAIPSGLVDAKGDLIVGTADNTVTRLPASTDGHVLTLDSAESAGVKWAAPPAGGTSVATLVAPVPPPIGEALPILSVGVHSSAATIGTTAGNSYEGGDLIVVKVAQLVEVDSVQVRVVTPSDTPGALLEAALYHYDEGNTDFVSALPDLPIDAAGLITATMGSPVALAPGNYAVVCHMKGNYLGTNPTFYGLNSTLGKNVATRMADNNANRHIAFSWKNVSFVLPATLAPHLSVATSGSMSGPSSIRYGLLRSS